MAQARELGVDLGGAIKLWSLQGCYQEVTSLTSIRDTCLLPDCFPGSDGSLDNLLLRCPALSHTRSKLLSLCFRVAAEHDELYRIITCVLNSDSQVMIMQFLLDCTTMPEIIRAVQVFGSAIRDRLLYIGRTWCYNIHRGRMTQLGLLDFR